MTLTTDILIVGGGMAGASLAAEIAGKASVLMIEAESQPGYHSTGRSAAFWSETYGGPLIQPLTTASGPLLSDPSPHFSDRSFLGARGALYIADAEGRDRLDALHRLFRDTPVRLEPLSRPEVEILLPRLKSGWDYGLWEPTCSDIDVAALHAAYLKQAKGRGARLLTDARLITAMRRSDGWEVTSSAGEIRARILVNAAGAWADEVAKRAGELPLGIQPYRRTVAQLRVDPAVPCELPLVLDARQRFYFKPEGGRLWLSPHDETKTEPCDAAPEEYDVAIAIHEFEQVVDWPVKQVERKWAGLRSFAPDRLPVYGFPKKRRDFFWCAGQGGFGIQTAPAGAKLAASLLLRSAPDPAVAAIDPEPYLASRFMN